MARLLSTLASAGAVALCVATGSPALSSSPRGWNSWYNFLGASDENATLAAAQYLVTSGLSNLGYTTVTIDEGWSEDSNGIIIDGYGRLTWNQQMYPNGLPWLAQQLHGMGLKLGLWIVRGIPRKAVENKLPIFGTQYTADEAGVYDRNCSWSSLNYGTHGGPAAVAYYESLAASMSSWGVDFVKIDCMWPNRYEGTPQTYFNEDVDAQLGGFAVGGPALTVSLSPGISVSPQNGSYISAHGYASMYRIAEDVLDVWMGQADGTFPQGVHQKLTKALEYESLLGANSSWPDFDMLQVGYTVHSYNNGSFVSETHLTKDEQVTAMTLWCFTGTPLVIGGRLPLTDDANGTWTLALLSNTEVLAVHNESIAGSRRSFTPAEAPAIEVYGWTATPMQPPPGQGYYRSYVSLYNADANPQGVSFNLTQVGFPAASATSSVCVRDLWGHSWIQPVAGPLVTLGVPSHGARALLVTTAGDAACQNGL